MLALHNFHDAKLKPPAITVNGPDGKPWHSWRVLILPFIEEEALYNEYRFDEPWNGPNNSKLASKMPDVFRCPSFQFDHENHKVAEGELTIYLRLIDGAEPVYGKGVCVVEAPGQPVHWMAPEDITRAEFIDQIESEFVVDHEHRGCQLGYANASVQFQVAERESLMERFATDSDRTGEPSQ